MPLDEPRIFSLHMSDHTKQLDFFNEQKSRSPSPRIESPPLPRRSRIMSLDEKRIRKSRYGVESLSQSSNEEVQYRSTWLQDQLGRAERGRGSLAPEPIISTESIRRHSTDSAGSLSRTMSWPNQRRTSTIPQLDLTIFTIPLMKQNRHGKFQKRVVRLDGTLLVCFSAKKDRFKRFVSDVGLLDSPHKTISDDFKNCLRDYYPTGVIPSMAQSILATPKPDPFTPSYLVPKWVIPIQEIIGIETNISDDAETKHSRTFVIKTNQDSYTFQAYTSSDLLRFKYLIDSLSFRLEPTSRVSMSDTIRVMEQQRLVFQKYQREQREFKRVLCTLLQNDVNMKEQIVTLQSHSGGIKVLNGIVIQPPASKKLYASDRRDLRDSIYSHQRTELRESHAPSKRERRESTYTAERRERRQSMSAPERRRGSRRDSYSRFSAQKRLEKEEDDVHNMIYNESLPMNTIEKQIRELDAELASFYPANRVSYR